MKLKSIFCATLFLLGSMAATAQLEFGLTAGANLSTWDYTSEEFGEDFFTEVQNTGLGEGLGETSYLPGFHAGIYAIFEFGPLTLMPEVLYSQKGSSKTGILPDGSDIQARAHYLTVPLLIGLEPFDGFNIQVGPTFGLLMQDMKLTGKDYDVSSDLYETNDIGATVGLMYDWDGPGFASIRYTHGLTPLFKYDLEPNDIVIQNRNLWLSVGFPIIFRGEKTGDSY